MFKIRAEGQIDIPKLQLKIRNPQLSVDLDARFSEGPSEVIRREWLLEAEERAKLDDPLCDFAFVVARHGNYAGAGVLRVGFDPAGDFEPVHPGQAQVKENNIRLECRHLVAGIKPVHGDFYFKPRL